MQVWVASVLMLVIIAGIIRFFSGSWKKAFGITSAWSLNEILEILYDYVIWGWLEYRFGVIQGSLYASAGAILQNFIFLSLYQKNGKDWFGFQHLSQTWFLKNRFLAFIILSWKGSFITTAFFLRNKSGKLEKRDYFIFIASSIFSCLYWSVIVGTIVALAKMVWRVVIG